MSSCRAGLCDTGASVNVAPELASNSVLDSHSGKCPQVATVTEQQQQFVQQMLQALAYTNNGVRECLFSCNLVICLCKLFELSLLYHQSIAKSRLETFTIQGLLLLIIIIIIIIIITNFNNISLHS